MHTFEQHPDKLMLPGGWKEHYDPQRKIWYYVDLESDPPRLSLVHPGEYKEHRDKKLPTAPKPTKESLRLSPTQRPIGPRESASSSNGGAHPFQRPRRATVAQQLYASSITSGSKESSSSETIPRSAAVDVSKKAITSSRRLSASSTAVPEAINTPVSSANNSSSASSSGCVSPTSPISPIPGMDVHNPRNFLDCTRLTGTRRGTYSGPQPSLVVPRNVNKSKFPPIIIAKDDAGLGVDAFYPPSVKTTPSPMPLRSATEPNNFALAALTAPDNYQMKDTAYSRSSSNGSSISLMNAHGLSPHQPNPAATSALTRKSPRLNNGSSSPVRPTLPREAPRKESSSKRPLPPTKHVQLTEPPPPPPSIMQPKPIRPLGSVSLNLQVQVTGVDSESSPEEGADGAKKKKNPLLKTFNLGVAKNAKGKTPIRTIYDRQMLSSSPIPDEFLTGAI